MGCAGEGEVGWITEKPHGGKETITLHMRNRM